MVLEYWSRWPVATGLGSVSRRNFVHVCLHAAESEKFGESVCLCLGLLNGRLKLLERALSSGGAVMFTIVERGDHLPG